MTCWFTAGLGGCAQDSKPPRALAVATETSTPTPASDDRRLEREQMLSLLRSKGVDHPRVLAALSRVPRHRFVPRAFEGSAYADHPLPIGWGQTISQPLIVALMTQAVAPAPSDRCLEIGTGSGYQAALLAELCQRTYSIEYLPELARFSAKNLAALNYRVELRTGDGYAGWPEAAPFDVIVVTAAPEKVPQPLLQQLAPGGRLVIPVGPRDSLQELQLWRRNPPGAPEPFEVRRLSNVRFVPFVRAPDAGTK